MSRIVGASPPRWQPLAAALEEERKALRAPYKKGPKGDLI